MNQNESSATRRKIHSRVITCIAYARDDGLFDIEGVLIDTKPFNVTLPERSEIKAGVPIHELKFRLTIDRDLLIKDVAAETVHGPYGICGAISENYRRLIGQRIVPGFTGLVKRLFRATQGCSHLTEMIPVMATTAYQALWGDPDQVPRIKAENEAEKMPSFLGGCHALRQDGDLVKRYYPKWYRFPDKNP